MIAEDGQSQPERMPEALAAHYIDVDERDAAELMLFAKQLAPYINFHQEVSGSAQVVGDWSSFFPYDETSVGKLLAKPNAKLSPHLALFGAFVELYQKPQEVTNRITQRHLDFYYQDVLRLVHLPAVPDKAHVQIELKKNAAPITVSAGETFSAGKDQTKVELIYAASTDTVINTASVSSLRSIYHDSSGHGVVRYAPIANSADGVGGELDGDDPKWYGFGHAALPQAEVGFALSAPVLRMKEGLRKVLVSLKLGSVDRNKVTAATLSGAFEAFITGEKGWLGPYALVPSLTNDDYLKFDFTVAADEKAVVDHDETLHGYRYAAAAPVLQVRLKANGAVSGYDDFKDLRLLKAKVAVEVSGITALSLENDGGVLNPKKAFQPFGPQPSAGARFMVGYGEALAKKLSEVKITVQWKDAPGNFATHYQNYGINGIGNSYFTAGVSFADGGNWQFSRSGEKLFESANAASEHTFTFSTAAPVAATNVSTGMQVYALYNSGSVWGVWAANSFILQQPVFAAYLNTAPEAREDFITFTLEKGFQHDTYRIKYAENVIKYSKGAVTTLVLLNEPYTPVISSITLSYKAYSDEVSLGTSLNDFANDDLRLYHLAYFGQMREHGYQRAQFDFLIDKNVTLLPRHEYQGELLIGFENLAAGDSVSVLFQVAEGSAAPDFAQEHIDWCVLCDNYWQPLDSAAVVQDTSNQLLASGLIKFVIPHDATTTNTLLPPDMIWIKGAVKQNVTAVSQLIDVLANVIEVRFADQGNDPNHLLTALAAGGISKAKTAVAAVKKISQPYASFGGAAAEADDAFHTRVAERLRHKNCCITAWDYERIVLQAFPKVHKVKCIPHAQEGKWLSPGHVLLVVIPDLRNQNAVDPLQPKVDADTISRIRAQVTARTGMQVKLKVKNPAYQRVQIDFKVKFHRGYEYNYYRTLLEQEIIAFLSPWAFDSERDLSFGGKIYKSVVLDFVEEREYVDYVTDFKLYSYQGANNYVDLIAAEPPTPDSILVSDYSHLISEVL